MRRARAFLVAILPAIAGSSFGQTIPMPRWLGLPDMFEDLTWLGLARWQWVLLGVLFLLSVAAGHIFRVMITVAFRLRYRLWEAKVTPQAGRGVKRALVWLVAAGLWWLALPELRLPTEFGARVYTALQIVTVGAFVWLAYSLWDAACDTLAERTAGLGRRTEKLLVPVTRKFVRALILIAGSLVVLGALGVNVSGILAGVGIGGLVVALAAKDSVENIFGSFTILFDMPFALGDWVKIGPIEGAVEEINLRSTRIRTAEDSVITLPNSNLIRASVENLGARRHRRMRFTFGIAYNTPRQKLEGFLTSLRELVRGHAKVLYDSAVVELNEFTDVSLRILIDCGIEAGSTAEEMEIRSVILMDVNDLAQRLGVQIQGAPPPAG